MDNNPKKENIIQIIKDKIKSNNNKISFAEYMQICLYHPNFGYYTKTHDIIGKSGDFITASMVSDIFGKCYAKSFSNILSNIENANILEFGAGVGKFAVDVLKELSNLDSLPKSYYILEISPSLKFQQQKYINDNLKKLKHIVKWITKLPTDFDGIIFANEVLDAMPCNIFKKIDNKIYERNVVLHDDNIESKYDICDNQELIEHVKYIENSLKPFPNNYTSEVNLWHKPWIESLYQCMRSGVVYLSDYGDDVFNYYHNNRNTGTMRCFYQHTLSDNIFDNIGQQDITSNVDFTNIAYCCENSGFTIDGFLPQSYFLAENHLEKYFSKAYENKDGLTQTKVAQEIKILTQETEMGSVFKVFVMSKNYEDELECFDKYNFVNKL